MYKKGRHCLWIGPSPLNQLIQNINIISISKAINDEYILLISRAVAAPSRAGNEPLLPVNEGRTEMVDSGVPWLKSSSLATSGSLVVLMTAFSQF